MSEKKKSFKGFMPGFEVNKSVNLITQDFIKQRRNEVSNQIVEHLRESAESLKKARNECDSFYAFKKRPKKDISIAIQQVKKIISAKDDFWQPQKVKK